MEPLNIQIGWMWALGIIGTLLVLAWKANGRFTKIETNVDWLIEGVKELKSETKVDKDNKRLQAFGNASPVRLMPAGEEVLKESGLKEYIDNKTSSLIDSCKPKQETTAYEVQEHIFDLFDNLEFEAEIDKRLKEYAFQKGIAIETIRRIGAIYFRDICLNNFKMKVEDLDKLKVV